MGNGSTVHDLDDQGDSPKRVETIVMEEDMMVSYQPWLGDNESLSMVTILQNGPEAEDITVQ
jgi:hypothetical protein